MHGQQVGEQLVLPRAGRARRNALAFEVLEAVDAAVCPCDQLYGFGIKRTQRAQILERCTRKLALAVVGRIQNVSGHESRFDVFVAQQFRVAHRRTGCLGCGGDFLSVDNGLVRNHLRQHAAQWVVGTPRTTGSNTEEDTLLRNGATGQDGGSDHQGQRGSTT